MDFAERIRQFSNETKIKLPNLKTEEATKTALILPFLSKVLGYDTTNPLEVEPEFISDVGTKTREKVDYAILDANGKPCILIEAKPCTEPLEKHDSQLFRYFAATQVKFAILTNGVNYRFYTDLQNINRMDPEPFLEFDIREIKENLMPSIKKFAKGNFNIDELMDTATKLQYSSRIMAKLGNELKSPSDEFLKLLLKDVHEGPKTQAVLEKLRPIAIEAFEQYVTDIFSERLRPVMGTAKPEEPKMAENAIAEKEEEKSAVDTTEEELEAFRIVKAIVCKVIDIKRVSYRDTIGYFSIVADNSRNRWFCRFFMGDTKKRMLLCNMEESIYFDSIEGLYAHGDAIISALQSILQQ